MLDRQVAGKLICERTMRDDHSGNPLESAHNVWHKADSILLLAGLTMLDRTHLESA